MMQPRHAGGSLAQAIYTTILTNSQTPRAATTLPAAAIAAGMTTENATKLAAALPLGPTYENIPGITPMPLLQRAWRSSGAMPTP
jgi:hypothetical protein